MRYREAPDRLRIVYRLLAGWYVIWFAVGLFFVGLNLPSLFGPIEDFLFMFLAAMVILVEAVRRVGWMVTLVAFGWVAIVSGAVETLGALTGFPFGSYQYTGAFGPRVLGVLPVAIPFSWWVMLIPLQIIFMRLSERNWLPMGVIPLLVGLSAAMIDLVLEPVATLERGYWIWGSAGRWYGVPWTNFAGWFFTAAILSAGLQFLVGPALRRSYGWEVPSAHMVPILILLSVVFTFLLASAIAGYWLASLLALVIVLLLIRALRRCGVFNLRPFFGRI